MDSVLTFVHVLLYVYLLCILVWALLSWIVMFAPSMHSNPAFSSVQRFLNSVIEPVCAPIRKVIPPVRMGGTFLDVSAIIVMVIVYILIAVLPS